MISGKTEKVGIILLAAGSSSRMGEPKQLLEINRQPLLRLMAKQAVDSKANETIVVVGHRADEIKKTIQDLSLKILFNEHSENGMGSSVKCGISFLKENDFAAALIITCDQPFLTSSHLNKMMEAYRHGKNLLAASKYSDSVGIPALFDQKLFDQLLSIDDSQGAKKVINENISGALILDFPQGEIDLDTVEDYRAYLQLVDKNKNQ
jgi:molybdenum cofactor cytidylyltransferase